jgi:hypothetical protein
MKGPNAEGQKQEQNVIHHPLKLVTEGTNISYKNKRILRAGITHALYKM